MTFDREPDLDNANVGIPEQKRKSGKLPNRWLSFFIAFIAKNYGTGEEGMTFGAVVYGLVSCRIW